jgi:predicted neutral ceramidase superfamily lipid hydrolase
VTPSGTGRGLASQTGQWSIRLRLERRKLRRMSYFLEYIAIPAALASFVGLLIPPLAMVALTIVVLAAAAAVLALVGAILATPVLAVRSVLRRRSGQRAEDRAYAFSATVGSGS